MLTISEIEEAIARKAPGSWQVATTSVWNRLGSAGDSGLFGLRIGDDAGRLHAASESFDALASAPPPTRIDWRTEGGGRLTPIRDQGVDCGACVAFATIAAAEAKHWIGGGERLDLSEAELFHCNGGSCDDGWGLAAGLDAAASGLTRRSDAPWTAKPECRRATPVVRVSSFSELRDDSARRRAVAIGPVIGGMDVYEDLSGYVGGVYRHVIGGLRGKHAICIVGYDDGEGCWIARNSWGDGWGDGGYFRIAYGECGIEDLPFYSCEIEVV